MDVSNKKAHAMRGLLSYKLYAYSAETSTVVWAAIAL